MNQEPRIRPRFPRRLYEAGSEPDARFSLANERTFLAWIRTALALLASGVALEAFALPIHPAFRLAASLVLIITGIAAPTQAWFGWLLTEKSLRLGRSLPSPAFAAPLAVGVIGAGALVALGLLLR